MTIAEQMTKLDEAVAVLDSIRMGLYEGAQVYFDPLAAIDAPPQTLFRDASIGD